jgi:hypothetical protein
VNINIEPPTIRTVKIVNEIIGKIIFQMETTSPVFSEVIFTRKFAVV